ncbi:MAG: erythromycin esterase family protein [Luteolibacter sp.]
MVVWAHNSHLGDARATEMGNRGEWNVGLRAFRPENHIKTVD